MEDNKKYIWPISLGVIGLILGILSYIFYEPNIVISGSIIILFILVGFRIIRKRN